ncbi:MAG: NAD(P)H-dependent oxidoreductase [Noviherbaspirillum sp.]|nr:NAD(P)H-dependent oxidoreductase [Noviherbaspirillum sp.]
MGTYRIVGLTNSARSASYNRMALQLAAEVMPSDLALQVHDLSAIPFYDTDLEKAGFPPAVQSLAEAVSGASGMVIACPEFNHSMPAVLKNALDWLSRVPGQPLDGQPVMILSASYGRLGGARVQYDLRRVLDAVGARPLVRPEVFIGMAHEKFDHAGRCIDEGTRRMVKEQAIAFKEWINQIRR